MRWIWLIAALCMVTGAPGAMAQNFPTKPVRLIIGFAPGGISDSSGRVVAQALSKTLGQSVVPENKPGAGGVIGASFTARSRPDGYTLFLADPGTLINPLLRKDVSYKASDLTSVGLVGSSPPVIVVSNAFPVKTLAELIQYGKANPGKINFATAGVGSAPHLAAEVFLARTGVKAIHVPYPGIGRAYPDIMSGKVQMAFSSIVGALPFARGNKVRALATTGKTRPAAFRDIPTVGETGIPDYAFDIWLALVAPKGIPAGIATKLNTALVKALKEPDVVSALGKMGIEARSSSVEEANAFLAAENKRWPDAIAAAHLGPK